MFPVSTNKSVVRRIWEKEKANIGCIIEDMLSRGIAEKIQNPSRIF